MQLGEPRRKYTGTGRDDGDYEASVLVSCAGFGVNVKAGASTPPAVADLLRSVADTVQPSSRGAPAAHRRDPEDRRLVGCYRVLRDAGSGTSIRCLDAGGVTRARREEEATSRPRGPAAPPVDAEWRAGTWQQWNGNLLLCGSREGARFAQYAPLVATADGFAFRDERWTRAPGDAGPPSRVEKAFEPGPGRVDAELTLPAGLGWDDDAPAVRRKLSPLLAFVSERREDPRSVVHVYSGAWKPGISSSRIELQFRDGRLSSATLSWTASDVASPSRKWEELVAKVAADHGAPQGLPTVKAVWAEVLKREAPTARGRQLLDARPEAEAASVCEPNAEPLFKKPEFPRGADPYALLDAVLRGERMDFLVTKWDVIDAWQFRRDAAILVAMFPAPPGEGTKGPVVFLGWTAPK